MKKRIINFVLALVLVAAGTVSLSASANAETKDWMTYTFKGGSAIDFKAEQAEGFTPVTDAMPGDTISYNINYVNGAKEAAAFYMNAKVVESLEKANEEVGGGYSYVITNNGTELFNSKTVGGDATEKLGLKQASGDTGVYFSLGDVAPGKGGTVNVSITLDGDSQANIYEDKAAELEFYFKAETESLKNKTIEKTVTVTNSKTKTEVRTETKPGGKKLIKTLDNGTELVQIDDSDVPLAGNDNTNGGSPQTGDSILPFVICGIGFLLGMGLIGCYIKLVNDKKKEVA